MEEDFGQNVDGSDIPSELIEVTGISSSEPSTAVAEFTSRWVPTDYGKELGAVPSSPETNNANFRLYDDGWRLVG